MDANERAFSDLAQTDAGIGGAFASVPGGALWLVVLAVVVVVGWRLAR